MEENMYDGNLLQIISYKANNLYEYLDLIKCSGKKSVLYIGERSIIALDFHIQGYESACRIRGIEEILNPPFGYFHSFVADYYSYGKTSRGWRQIILLENNNDEEKSLEVFWQLLDLFRKDENYLLKTV
ncbi:MAG: hypothetical protein MUF58_04260 [Arcicella sp.]|jgi:hypothetical protein|nr:hypothetical protein [Arcicella sp.]